MVRLRIQNEDVSLVNGQWMGASAELRAELRAITDFVRLQPPTGDYVPDPDIPLAEMAVRLLGAQIVERVPLRLKKDAIA